MKKSFLLFLLFSLFTSFQSLAQSDFILEPYVGYEMGYLTQKGIPEITLQGANFGARLGYVLSGIGLGLDYMTGSGTSKQSGQTGDFKPADYGIFVSYKSEGGMKIYGTYFASAKAKVQTEVNTQDFSGSGYKLGLGWRLYSFCEISLELISRNYTKYDQAAMTNSLLGSTAGISIAIPLL